MINIKEKNKDELNNKEDRTYRTYTLLFCAISFLVFWIFLIRNKSFIWESDGIKQHFIILYDFNQIVRNIFNEGIPMLSWNMGLGLDIIGQYSYYVIGDPFVYLSLLFPMEHLETAYNILVLLRIYCVGLAYIAYCKYNKKENINTIIGAIIYTFCGFILFAGVRHPYFTNAAIFLPLTLIGTDKLLKENKKIYLAFIIFVSALSNYYFFYMITIINIIYGIIKYMFQYNDGIKEFFKKIGSAILCYLIGILMASIVLLPTVYAFLNSARTESEQVTTYINGFYKFFFMGLISLRFKNWAVIGVSSIIILMLPILFTKLKNKENRSYIALFIITTIMLLIPQIGSMMNGFSFPSNRWVFAYSFILSYIVTICYDSKIQYTKKQKIYMLITIVIYTIIGIYITNLKIKKNLDYYVVGAIAYLIFVIISYNYKKEKRIKIANYIVILLVITNIFILSSALYLPIGKGYVEEFIESGTVEEQCSTSNEKIENFKEAIRYIKENDKEFYRIAKKDISYQNLSLIYDYNPIQLYLSLGNKNVYELSCSLEDNCYSCTKCVNGADRRTKITTLLGAKYYICEKKDSKYVPYGYTIYHQIGDTLIYINENYLPVGIIYDSYITKEQYEKLSPLEKEDSLITTAMIEDTTNLKIQNNKSNIINKPVNLEYIVKDNKIVDNTINITKNNDSIELIVNEIPNNYEIYLNINNIKYITDNNNKDFKVSVNFNGINNSEDVKDFVSSAYYMENPDFLMNLGITKDKSNNKVKITFNKKGTYTFDSLNILAVSMGKYEEKINKLETNVMKNIKYGNDYILGTVNTDKNGILQITTSYSDGWKAYVDGNEVDVLKVNESFIGINIEEGQHNVKFEYETPYLKLGIVFSIFGLLAFIILMFIERKKKDNVS